MGNPVYKKIEIVGTSATSITDAIDVAIASAGDTNDNLTWFEVQEIRGHIENGKVSQYQVVVKAGCRL